MNFYKECCALLCALLCYSSALAAEPPTSPQVKDLTQLLNGRWRWQFTMPDGTSVKPVASLRWDGTRLSGKTRFRHATETPISKGVVDGNRITFQVSRTVYGKTVVTRYSGIVQGENLVGKMESNWAGELQSYPWEATRLPDTPEGTWKWDRETGERKLEAVLKAKLEGEKITGKVQIRRASADVLHGRFKDGMIRFQIEGKLGGEPFSSSFEGKLMGDQIHGKERLKTGKQEQLLDWEAEREN